MQSKLFFLVLTAILFTLSVQTEVMTHKQFISYMKSLIPRTPRIVGLVNFQDIKIYNNLAGNNLLTDSKYPSKIELKYYANDATISSGSAGSSLFSSSSNLRTEDARDWLMWNMGNGQHLALVYQNYFKPGNTGLGVCLFSSLRTDRSGNILPEERQSVYNELTTQDPSRWRPQCLYLLEGSQIYDLYFNRVRLSARVFADLDSNTNQVKSKVLLSLG